MKKDKFKNLRQEFDKNVLDLVKQKVFHPYEYIGDLKKFKEELPNKNTFYSSLTDSKISDEEYEVVLNVWNKFQMKTMKDCHDLYLKCDILLLADLFEKIRKNSLKNYERKQREKLTSSGKWKGNDRIN